MAFLLFLILYSNPICPLEEVVVAQVKQNYIENISEICGEWKRDENGTVYREGICRIPRKTPIIVNNTIFTDMVIIREEDTDTVRTYIGKTKKKLILWTVLV